MTWYEMVHQLQLNMATAMEEADSDVEKNLILETHEKTNEIIKVESLARIATALEKMSGCAMEIPTKDFIN